MQLLAKERLKETLQSRAVKISNDKSLKAVFENRLHEDLQRRRKEKQEIEKFKSLALTEMKDDDGKSSDFDTSL